MDEMRVSKAYRSALVGGMVLAVAVAVWQAPSADWDLALFGILLGFSVFSDLTAIETSSKLKTSGSFLALVLAIVFLGGPPAAAIGVLTIAAGWLRWRDNAHDLLVNVL